MENTIEILKYAFTIISPFIAAYLTYYFAVKEKSAEIDLQKKRDVNIILADLLDIWFYLNKINVILNIKRNKNFPTPLPPGNLLFNVLNSGNQKEDGFEKLEKSVENIKKYDAIIYYELEGIGRDIEYLKANFILPFVSTPNNSEVGESIAFHFLEVTLDDLEQSVLDVGKLAGRTIYKKTKSKIIRLKNIDYEKIENEYLEEYYRFLKNIIPMPEEIKQHFTKENMIELFNDPEMKEIMDKQFEILSKHEIGDIMGIIAQNPDISFEEFEQELKK